MNYAQLVAPKATANSISAWLNWDLAPVTDILAEAEAYIYGKLRVREMKDIATGTIADDALTLALPSNFIAPISFRRVGPSAGKISILDSQHMETRNAIDANGVFMESVPTECQIIGDPPVAHFNCEADDDYPYRLVYWARKNALSVGNPTNFLTSRYPTLLRTACLFRGFRYQKDYTASEREQKDLDQLIFDANSEYDLGEQANVFATYQEDD